MCSCRDSRRCSSPAQGRAVPSHHRRTRAVVRSSITTRRCSSFGSVRTTTARHLELRRMLGVEDCQRPPAYSRRRPRHAWRCTSKNRWNSGSLSATACDARRCEQSVNNLPPNTRRQQGLSGITRSVVINQRTTFCRIPGTTRVPVRATDTKDQRVQAPALAYEPGGRRFESCRAHQINKVHSGHMGASSFRGHG